MCYHHSSADAERPKAAATPGGGDADEDSDAEGASHNGKHRTRDMLLDILQERVYDSNAYTRAAAMRTFTSLVSSGRLPLTRVHAVTALAADRLKDRAAGVSATVAGRSLARAPSDDRPRAHTPPPTPTCVQVRKAAMQLISTLLERNPFGGTLDAGVYKEQVSQLCRRWPPAPTPAPTPALCCPCALALTRRGCWHAAGGRD